MPARLALFVAPFDPLVSNAPARLEALGWLRNQFIGRGFQISILGSGDNPIESLRLAVKNVAPGDVVLVHVSARLASGDSIALGKTTDLALPALLELLAERSPGYVSLILDLVHASDLQAEGDPVTHLARSFGAEERGYSVLAAVRPHVDPSDRMAFTRLAMPPIDDGGPPSTEALLSVMHDRVAAAYAEGAVGPAFVLVRGAADATVDGLIAQATRARDWGRVVELRLDRADTLATVAQRAQELVGIARILQSELHDADGAVDVLEHARSLDPKRPAVLEALRHAYEASGRAPPIDPSDYTKAFLAHRRAGQTDAALLDAMVLEEVGVAEAEHHALVEQSRTAGPMQVLKALDGTALAALRAPGFDDTLAALLAAVHAAAMAARLDQQRGNRRAVELDPATRLDPESTVSAVRTFGWAARVLGVPCPDLYAGKDASTDAVTHVLRAPASIMLGPHVLSGTSAKQLAFLAGRALVAYRPEYQCLLHYPTLDELTELVDVTLEIGDAGGHSPRAPTAATTELRRLLARHLADEARTTVAAAAARTRARGGDLGLEHWIRSADLTAARVGLFLCGDLKTAVSGVRREPSAPGRPTVERITSDLTAFCASRAHATLRAQFLRQPSASVVPLAR